MNKTTTILAILALLVLPFATADEFALPIPEHRHNFPPAEDTPTQSNTIVYSHHSHYKGNLDKYGEYTFWTTKGRSTQFDINDNTYYFKLIGINIFGREIVAIFDANGNLARLTWLKDNEGELFFYKTKFPTYEKEYINYKIEPNRYEGNYRRITLFKGQ